MNWIEIDVPTHPLNDGKWVKIIAHIRRVADGEVRKMDDVAILNADEKFPSPFIWSDGNYACDCNRELFFDRAAGNKSAESACSDDRFEVNLVNPATGEIYYREFE